MASPKTYTAICNANGCQFLKAGLGKREAEREATSHIAMMHHDVSIVDMKGAKS